MRPNRSIRSAARRHGPGGVARGLGQQRRAGISVCRGQLCVCRCLSPAAAGRSADRLPAICQGRGGGGGGCGGLGGERGWELVGGGVFVRLLVACLTSQQQASVSQGRICSDKFTRRHTEIEVADPTSCPHPPRSILTPGRPVPALTPYIARRLAG